LRSNVKQRNQRKNKNKQNFFDIALPLQNRVATRVAASHSKLLQRTEAKNHVAFFTSNKTALQNELFLDRSMVF
jgi:hypothetical protein